MLDRLQLTEQRIAALGSAVEDVSRMDDSIGKVVSTGRRPNGLEVSKVRIPLGVVAMIYESRPNVTTDAAALALRSGNAVILRGGSEAFHSNQALGRAVLAGLERARLPAAAVQVLDTTDRDAMLALLRQEEMIDLVIPRGGEGLIRFVAEHSRIPVLKHYKGVCHLYVHKDADLDLALRIAENAKTSRPGVCNAVETILVDRDCASEFVPRLCRRFSELGVEIRGDESVVAQSVARGAASESDWDAEYLTLIVAVRVVDDLDGAIAHIETHGSNHTESIITRDADAAERFSRASIHPPSWSTRPRALPTAERLVWAPKLASARQSCTPTGPWEQRVSRRQNSSYEGTAR